MSTLRQRLVDVPRLGQLRTVLASSLSDPNRDLADKLMLARAIEYSERRRWSLLHLVQKAWEFNATDLKDKIYALLGRLAFDQCCLGSLTQLIPGLLFSTDLPAFIPGCYNHEFHSASLFEHTYVLSSLQEHRFTLLASRCGRSTRYRHCGKERTREGNAMGENVKEEMYIGLMFLIKGKTSPLYIKPPSRPAFIASSLETPLVSVKI
jgi:hypothetical protein